MRSLSQRAVELFATMTFVGLGCAGNLVTNPGLGNRVQVTLGKDAYASGDTVIVIIKNVSAMTLTYPYGFCKTALQRQDPGGWTRVAIPPDGCALALGILAPGESVPHQYILQLNLPGGTYRLTMPSPAPENATKPEPDLNTLPFSVKTVTSRNTTG